ncbi:lipocalin-like domain-containing protein [Geobacter sp.]|uniref:lipocalin-like domain-containing protein n=1 Tax=Geobacter sp. TaxID=46610 RepID=UPI0027B88C3E|nr:lipocalin-like domain-containing protein [Geobacter sp.]
MRRGPVLLVAVALLCAAALVWLLAGGRSAPRREPGISVADALGGSPPEGFLRASTPRSFQFPADHGPHPGFRTEWWYFTGNLAAAGGRRFGYQLTFFRVALSPVPSKRASRWGANDIIMGHFALTDVEERRFHHFERFSRSALGLAGAGGRPLRVWLEDWSATEVGEKPWRMRLTAREGDVAVDLTVTANRPVALNGDGGLSQKSGEPGNASYYYSLPRMETAGTVTAGGETATVTGLSWLDREWSTSALGPDQAGWDWFALQLDDGRDVMFYRLRRRDGGTEPWSSGTLVEADGSYRHLTREDVRIDVLQWWRSPASGVRYPSRWRFNVPAANIDLEITPRIPDQELLVTVRYWEGAVKMQSRAPGGPRGSGYVEMTGYGGEGVSAN